MEMHDNPQLELFTQKDAGQDFNTIATRNSFLARIWNYEKTILVAIGILVTGIVSFSLGVEKGKAFVLKGSSVVLEATQPKNAPPEIIPPAVVNRLEVVKQVMPNISQQGTFTIQVASFKTRINAQKEAEILKRKGLPTSFLTSGSYTVLCVGNFSNKEAAQPLLSELKKRYGSCLIRRL